MALVRVTFSEENDCRWQLCKAYIMVHCDNAYGEDLRLSSWKPIPHELQSDLLTLQVLPTRDKIFVSTLYILYCLKSAANAKSIGQN